MSLVRDSQSPAVVYPQGERLGSQLLRFRLRLDRSVRAANAEMAMSIDRNGSPTDLKTEIARQGAIELIDIPSDRIVPIPHLPLAVLGVYNWRGEVLWVVDLAVLLGANERQTERERRSYPTIVVRAIDPSSETKTIGLVVDEIADIEWCELVATEPHQGENSPWVKGEAIAPNGEKLTILDELAIVDRAELHADI